MTELPPNLKIMELKIKKSLQRRNGDLLEKESKPRACLPEKRAAFTQNLIEDTELQRI
jgi:hypothetical protein